jgi:hypothetical protein
MISDAPIAAASKLVELTEQVRAYIAVARSTAADGLTVSEVGELIVSAMRLAIATVDSIPVAGADRKTMVLEFVACVFDEFADKAVPLVAWPIWIIAKPAIRAVVLAAASGAIESLLPLVRAAK